MRATFNSILVSLLFTAVLPAPAADFRSKAEAAYKSAREAYKNNPNPSNAVVFAEACFEAGEFARTNDEREGYAKDGISVATKLTSEQPKLAAAHYYLAMNYGQLARVKQFSALKLVDMIEGSLKTAKALDPKFDYAGPDRGLGLLYRDAPGWPLSIGNKSKARQHLTSAVKLAPSFPENVLNLIEAHMQWKDYKTAREQLGKLTKALPSLKRQFSGEKWEPAWIDWNKRLQHLQGQLD